jgi:hypothetical protein
MEIPYSVAVILTKKYDGEVETHGNNHNGEIKMHDMPKAVDDEHN